MKCEKCEQELNQKDIIKSMRKDIETLFRFAREDMIIIDKLKRK